MDKFRCLRLSVLATVEETICLPAYQGSALRGAFGYALRNAVCVVRNRECPECLLKSGCVYSYAFETPPPSGSEMLRKYTSVPHPFVLNPMTGEKGLYKPGMTLKFGMTLVGRAAEYVPYFVFAFMKMGERGMGKGRGKFRVTRIDVLDSSGSPVEAVYENEILKSPETVLTDEDVRELARAAPSDRISLTFLTPLRVRYQDRFCREIQFHILIRSLLRRLSSLLYFHCGERLDIPFKEIIERAESVKLTRNETRWYDWERFSGRQKRRIKMGGVVGTVSYEGDITEFLPLLIAGAWVNVGKGTSFGLGNFELS